MLCDELQCERNVECCRVSDLALLTLKVPSLRLLVLLIRAVFKTTMRISTEHLWCVTEGIAEKYYCTWCKTCSTLILSAITLTPIGPGSNPDLRGNIHSLLYALRGYPVENTRYSRAYPPPLIYFLLVREDLLIVCTNAHSDIFSQ